MNKIYKVIYSKVRQCYVVVSEIAKSHGRHTKSSVAKSSGVLTAAVLIALGSLSFTTAFMPMTAEAASTKTDGSNFVGVERTDGLLDDSKYDNYGGKGAQGADSITLGLNAQAGAGTITIGDRKANASLGSVYVGQGDVANPKLDSGGWVTSIGYNSDATGYGSIALGSNAVAKNSYAKDSKGESLELNQTYVDNGVTKVRLNSKPDIQRASVAIGYGASADNGNIAIGSYSDASTDLRTVTGDTAKAYLTGTKADSYVSVGKSDALRRISNVADGAASSDVATVGQLQALSNKVGVYDAGFGIKIDSDTDKKTNTISLNRNLGTNLDTTGQVKLTAGDTGLVLGTVVKHDILTDGNDMSLDFQNFGATSDYAVTVGGDGLMATGKYSVALGGYLNKASGEGSTVSGGYKNTASGQESSVSGGFRNTASGIQSSVSGGYWNEAKGRYSSVSGGYQNTASGENSSILGGMSNTASGYHAVVVGGENNTAGKINDEKNSSVFGGNKNTANGQDASVVGGLENVASGTSSVVAGGDNNDAIGNQSAVFGGRDNTAAGIASTASGGIMNAAIGQQASALGGSYNYALGVGSTSVGGLGREYDNGTVSYDSTVNGNYSVSIAGGSTGKDATGALAAGHQAVVTTANGTAIGYQATTDEANTIAFGHDAGDVSGYTINWKQLPNGQTNADGTTNDYTQAPESVTETTYTKAGYNRLVKVADGQDAHDVVVMEQLDKAKSDLTDSLSVNAGWGINIADVTTKNDDNTETTTKNVISLNRNLGTNLDKTGHVYLDVSQTGLVLGTVVNGAGGTDTDLHYGATGDYAVTVGGGVNTASGTASVALGGSGNTASREAAVVSGGSSNVASGNFASVYGGFDNEASGVYATIFAGAQNKATRDWSTVGGGSSNNATEDYASVWGGQGNTSSATYASIYGGGMNSAIGNYAAILGGTGNTAGMAATVTGGSSNNAQGPASAIVGGASNVVTGAYGTALGGRAGNVNGIDSVGILGGSTGQNAPLTLAAGYQSVVTDTGVKTISSTWEEYEKYSEMAAEGKSVSGFWDTRDEDHIKRLDNFATALGYQATADESQTIAFGHDANDVSGYKITWKQRTDGQYNADGTQNDYTQDPEKIEETHYDTAYYNRLVKAADGIEDHDAVVMEQLKNASGVGSNIKVYKTDENGNVQFDENNNPIEDTGDTAKAQKDAAQKASEDAWGRAIGTGKVEANNPQLVTGKTIYDEVRPTQNGTYVRTDQTTGQNMSALDSALQTVNTKAGAHTALTVEGDTAAGKGQDEKTKENVYTGKNILLHESADANGKVTYDLKLAKDINIGTPGKDGEDGKIGIDGRDGHIGLNGSDGITVRGLDGENGAPGKDGVTITGPKGADGIDGKVGISGTDGKDAVSISGKDGVGHIGLTGPAGTNGKDGTNAVDITVKNGYDGTNGVNGKNGVDGTSLTRIVYEDANGEHQVATMEDGMKYAGDDTQNDATKVISKKLNNTLDIIGGADSTKLTDKNIGVNNVDGKLKVQLAKDLNGITSISNQTTTKDGDKDVTTGAKIDLGSDGSVDVNGGKITNVGSGADASGSYTTTTNAANIGDVQKIVKDAVDSVSDTTNKALAGKANIDASNIGANLKGADGKSSATDEAKTANENAWGSAIGTGKIEDGNGQLVTGKTVYDEVRPKDDGNYVKTDKTTGENLSALDSKIGKLDKDGNYIKKDDSVSQNLSTLDTQVKTNADNIAKNTESINNITNNMKNLSENAVKYDGSDKSKVTLGGEGGTTITNVKDGTLNEKSTEAVNGKQLYNEQQAREAADNAISDRVTNNTNEITKIKNGDFTDASKTAIHNIAKDAVEVVDGVNTTVTKTEGTDTTPTKYAVNVEGKGKVASGDTGLISGDTLYKEVHVDKDGSYIKSGNTVGQNLSSLDTGLKTTSDLIHTNDKGDTIQIGGDSTATKIDVSGKDKDGKSTGRVITGVVSDANDPNSAANVGYVNGITAASNEQIYRDMNMQYNHVENDISRAAAGSNALAALHPMQEFDPDDKAQFALGYGHYRNSNAGAVGAFYQPDENSLFSFGVSFGNGDAGLNAGVTFKFGPGGSNHHALTKTQMAKVIDTQSKEIDELKKDNADKDKRIEVLEQKMAEIMDKLDKNKD